MAGSIFMFLILQILSPSHVLAERSAKAEPTGIGPEQPDLVPQLQQALDADKRRDADSRLPGMEEALRPLYTALSKNEHGHLGPAAVRYALHRLFRRQHAWLVKGLAPTGDAWNVSAPVSALQHEVPDKIQQLFEQHLRTSGLNLAETAALGVMVEELVYDEAIERLHKAYLVQGLSVHDIAARDQWESAVVLYMMSYILKGDIADPKVRAKVGKIYPNWPATLRYIQRVMHDIVPPNVKYPTFADAKHVIREINARHGRWQDYECRSLKQNLVAMEGRCPGRVDLGEFHSASLHGSFQFSESAVYLRQLGALDESDPKYPKVIVPNYIDSPANFIGTSQFYTVVCLDECEELMGYVEREIRGPAATPEQIATLIRALPSSSVPGLRTLPKSLLDRLNDIAAVHGGRVPLHGRLFAQWMHHAYPRECPYPHVAGQTHLQLPKEFEKETGLKEFATKAEMRNSEETLERARDDATDSSHADRPCAPWSMVEELVTPLNEKVATKEYDTRAGFWGACVGALMMLPFVFLAARITRPVSGKGSEDGKETAFLEADSKPAREISGCISGDKNAKLDATAEVDNDNPKDVTLSSNDFDFRTFSQEPFVTFMPRRPGYDVDFGEPEQE